MMDKYDEFMKIVDDHIVKTNDNVDKNINRNICMMSDSITFRNMIKVRKYEFRKIASKFPFHEQHEVIYDTIIDIYRKSDLNIGDNADNQIKKMVRDIGVYTSSDVALTTIIGLAMLTFLVFGIDAFLHSIVWHPLLFMLCLVCSVVLPAIFLLTIQKLKIKFRLYRLK